ncbi:TcpJ [Clostridium perfringens]|uniref:TcpJ n=1 Tax=Clostridium perfringens TaxID=1502 RepID=UPI000D712ED9|nr:TcpJ [Clostridium perfringens]MBO3427897.1 TcpJ [Clostridium perfringens]PWW86711.1 TcpJ [Clostridium perfringens]PWW87664.1 TcpJ [Clostridium perfringens]PWX18415.1 TcpJ [Clostridium perfringens]PWX64013.1 TcpJ [Clostridium perfringens]
MKKKLVFLGLICLSLFAFVGCGTEKLDISNCIDVRYGEFNGSAKIYESSLDLGKLQSIPKLKGLTPDMLKGDYKITLVGDKTDLKNGDKVKLHLEYNKELYKKDFNVEFKFEPTEITIEGLKNYFQKSSDLTKSQWEDLYKNSKQLAEKKIKEKNLSDLELKKVYIVKEKDINPYIDFTFTYNNSSNEKRFLSVINQVSFDKNNNLNNSQSVSMWDNIKVDYTKTLEENTKELFPNSEYITVWSEESK